MMAGGLPPSSDTQQPVSVVLPVLPLCEEGEHEEGDNRRLAWVVGGSRGHVIEAVSQDEGLIRAMYENYPWKPIPGCTGRYTLCRRERSAYSLHPVELVLRCQSLTQKFVHSTSLRPPPQCWSFEIPGKGDPILVVPLDGRSRAGLITYLKLNRPSAATTQKSRDGTRGGVSAVLNASAAAASVCGEEEEEEGCGCRYVHTFNLPSGFRRKLEALGLTVMADDTIGVAQLPSLGAG